MACKAGRQEAHRRRGRPTRSLPAAALAVATAAALVTARGVLQAFVGLDLPSLAAHRASRRHGATELAALRPKEKLTREKPGGKEVEYDEWNDPYQAQSAVTDWGAKPGPIGSAMGYKETTEWTEREVKVTDMRDINELLRLPNPMKPTPDIQLIGITLDDGKRIENVKPQDLRRLSPSTVRPVYFHWKDKTRQQTRAPKQYDDLIQRLLNAGPAEMEDLVRANWKAFDKGFYFRLQELQEDCKHSGDQRLLDRITNLRQISLDLLKASQEQFRKMVPDHAKEAREIMEVMLEPVDYLGNRPLLWPPTPEAYQRLAETIARLTIRNKHEDAWFENVLEVVERFAMKMEVKGEKQLMGMAQVIMQRLITEWLRYDSLWEETKEGRFLFRLMTITNEQWFTQLTLETDVLSTEKLRDELKIISETKVIGLPMASKLQVYAAKYLQGLHDFILKKDEMLKKAGKVPQS